MYIAVIYDYIYIMAKEMHKLLDIKSFHYLFFRAFEFLGIPSQNYVREMLSEVIDIHL